MKIGILREGKTPIDRRVPLTPLQCKEVLNKYSNVSISVQPSPVRCFKDDEYRSLGIPVKEDLGDCELLLGVKEVQIPDLIPNKKYLFFSHVIKKQPYNRELLRTILKKNIQLIDWECLTDKNGQRIIAFGRYAGIVGAYNGILTFGKRQKLFDLKAAHQCRDLDEMKQEYKKISSLSSSKKLSGLKIAITGGGRVAKGAMEVLNGMNIRKVITEEFLNDHFVTPVYVQLHSKDYHRRKILNSKFEIRNSKLETRNPKFETRKSKIENRKSKIDTYWDNNHFYKNPQAYESTFYKFTGVTDLLIAAAYWDPKAPVLFTTEDMRKEGFKIKIIADVTGDIEGSIPSTKKFSSIDDPVYDYNPITGELEPPFSNETNISVMAIDNLPCELPKDASKDFGTELINNVLPNIFGEDKDGIIERATIARQGKLTSKYAYLKDYVDGA
ncbi:MAG: alanine dehydrogenase [Bacteroidetes bacterium]|nr:alanine dehydrogenase [Bacteroidota bacterium]